MDDEDDDDDVDDDGGDDDDDDDDEPDYEHGRPARAIREDESDGAGGAVAEAPVLVDVFGHAEPHASLDDHLAITIVRVGAEGPRVRVDCGLIQIIALPKVLIIDLLGAFVGAREPSGRVPVARRSLPGDPTALRDGARQVPPKVPSPEELLDSSLGRLTDADAREKVQEHRVLGTRELMGLHVDVREAIVAEEAPDQTAAAHRLELRQVTGKNHQRSLRQFQKHLNQYLEDVIVELGHLGGTRGSALLHN